MNTHAIAAREMKNAITLHPLAALIAERIGTEALWRLLADAALKAVNNGRPKRSHQFGRNRQGFRASLRFFEGLESEFAPGTRCILTYGFYENEISGQLTHESWRLKEDEIALMDAPEAVRFSVEPGRADAFDILPLEILRGRRVLSADRCKTQKWKVRFKIEAGKPSIMGRPQFP